MKKTVTFLLIVLWAACGVVSAAPARDVLAHSSGDWVWFAHVNRVGAENLLSNAPPVEHTEAFVRQNGPGQVWRALPAVPGRATALASRSSQLVLLMADGQWMTLWDDGSATGQPLPADGKILALTDDGDNLWAIGSVPGGRVAADAAIVKMLAATRPSTGPTLSIAAALAEPEPVTTRPAPEPGLVIFHQRSDLHGGRWMTFAELPHDASVLSGEQVSLAVVGRSPMVSYRLGKRAIKTLRWDAGNKWTEVQSMEPPLQSASPDSIDDFKLFTDGAAPLFWWTFGNSAGELMSETSAQPARLEWKGSNTLDGLPAVTFFGGFVRVLGPHNNKIFEQRYESRGEPRGEPAELLVPNDAGDASLMEWVEALFLIAVSFSIGANVYRQWTQPATSEDAELPTPAPLGRRLGAGLVDLIPIIAVGLYLFAGMRGQPENASAPPLVAIELSAAAITIYLLHTTVVEALAGRTVGKMLFGLTVLTTERTPPTPGQIVTRNLLRLVDPLVMIMVSPLRQRSGDVVAGTMVVMHGDAQPKATEGNDPKVDDFEPDNGKDRE